MKKRAVSIIAVIIFLVCLPMYGCASADKRKYSAWKKTLTAEEFKLHSVMNDYFSESGSGNLKTWESYSFYKLSNDDILYTTISMSLDTDMHYVFRPLLITKDILQKGEELNIYISFDVGTEVKQIPATLNYKTTNGEYVSKDYVLDFTSPLWDKRE